MSKLISTTVLSPTLKLSECTDGFWLWDETREMNLSMRAKKPNDALVEALTYYQNRLTLVEARHKDLLTKVEAFVGNFVEDWEGLE